MKVNFSWSEPTTNDTFDEYFQPDQLDREKYAQFLTSFLAQQGFDQNRDAEKQKRNYVLNLNAEWGAGKSYFLKRWALTLEEHYPVVYIDAWKQDYSDDPLMTVISSMIKQLRKQAGKDADKNVFKVSRKLVGLLKAATPALARGLTAKYLKNYGNG
ncbi:P-loop NTPase fold protein [Photobacterium leiognathi]|uniref:P-loop NTPase fold protein n=1 Tax=Photobacterium leiognathi TaxID=553611 RepID=UPI0029824EDB|nr:P-loop NTPase fold protein [Photobacterium leiognathi]